MEQKKLSPQEQQQMVQKLLQQKNEAAGDLLDKALHTETMPEEYTTSLWRHAVNEAIIKTQPFSQRISLEAFARVVAVEPKFDAKFTLFQFGVLTNALDTVSVEQLSLSRKEYVTMVEDTSRATEYYKKRMKEIQDEIQAKIEEDFKERDEMVKSGKNILKPVIGEA